MDQRHLTHILLATACLFQSAALFAAAELDPVFYREEATYEKRLVPAGESFSRVVTVRNPLGEERGSRVVRIPVFFHEGEVDAAAELTLRYKDGGQPVVFQADDIRRGPDGGVARCALYARVDFEGRSSRVLELKKSANGVSGAAGARGEVKRSGDFLTFSKGSSSVRFFVEGKASGRLKEMRFGAQEVVFDKNGAGPAGNFALQNLKCERVGAQDLGGGDDVSVKWGAGAVFAKLSARYSLEDLGGYAVYEYRFFWDEDRIEQRYYTGRNKSEEPAALTVSKHIILAGKQEGRANWEAVDVAVGLREDLPFPHGHAGKALRNGDGFLYPVPYVQYAIESVTASDGLIEVRARRQMRDRSGGSGAMRGIWGACDYLFGRERDLAAISKKGLAQLNPPGAIVDEPGLGRDALLERLQAMLRSLKPVGREPQIVKGLITGDREKARTTEQFRRLIGGDVEEAAVKLAEATKAIHKKKVEEFGRPANEFEKGKIYGRLDPYHLTYQASVVAAVAADREGPHYEAATDYAYVLGRAIMEAAGTKDAKGAPYLNTFFSALNMQVGPLALGVVGAVERGDEKVLTFYRGLANAEGVRGLYGKGQRSYGSLIGKASQSDLLYQDLSDYFLRAAELISGEGLSSHPAAYARYLHCLSVDADLITSAWTESEKHAGTNYRANMFRGQHHDHRWEKWNVSPFMALIWPGAEWEAGYADACYELERLKGKWQNWPAYSYLFMLHELCRAELRSE